MAGSHEIPIKFLMIEINTKSISEPQKGGNASAFARGIRHSCVYSASSLAVS